MSGDKNSKNSGRVTTLEFHNELKVQTQVITDLRVEQTKERGEIRLAMSAMELRIVDRINAGISSQQDYQQGADAKFATDKVRIGSLEGDVEKLEKWDKRIGILSAVSSIIAGILGIDRLS